MKSYDNIREHNDALSRPDYVPSGKEILTEYPKGSSIEVPLHDGSILSLEKLSDSYDPTDKIKAIQNIQESQRDAKVLTEKGYHIKRAVMVDMFPHTPHIETVVLFSK